MISRFADALMILLATMAGVAIIAQAAGQPTDPGASAPRGVSHLIGQEIINPKGQPVGRLHDVVMDWRDARAAYYVLSRSDGADDSQARLYAVPTSVLERLPGGKARLMLNLTPAGFKRLDRLKGTASQWPARIRNPFARSQPRPPSGISVDQK